MNIQKMMEEADKEERTTFDLEEARKNALCHLKELRALGEKSGTLWRKRVTKKTDEIVSDFKALFQEKGFSISTPAQDKVEAKYKNLIIEFTGINNDDEYMFIHKADSYGIEFKVDTLPTDPDYRVYKHNFVVGAIRHIDFMVKCHETGADADSLFLNALNSIEEINQVEEIITKNKAHFEESIKVVDTAELYILVRGDDTTYSDFKAFISAVDLG